MSAAALLAVSMMPSGAIVISPDDSERTMSSCRVSRSAAALRVVARVSTPRCSWSPKMNDSAPTPISAARLMPSVRTRSTPPCSHGRICDSAGSAIAWVQASSDTTTSKLIDASVTTTAPPRYDSAPAPTIDSAKRKMYGLSAPPVA